MPNAAINLPFDVHRALKALRNLAIKSPGYADDLLSALIREAEDRLADPAWCNHDLNQHQYDAAEQGCPCRCGMTTFQQDVCNVAHRQIVNGKPV